MAKSTGTLTEEEKQKLEKDVTLVSEFKRNKFEKEAQKNWDIFYKRNTTKFFKDRHWTRREFVELINSSDEECLVVFEVGCGVGNFMFPLMAEDKNLYFFACDFSQRAVQFVKENPGYDPGRCTVFHCDIVNDDLTNQVPDGVVDVATMVFVLSAIHPDRMETALRKICKTLKPGGCLLIRDYGLYDYAMLRFAPGHKLSENFYVRQDGTRAYYFSLEMLETLMRSSGFEVSSSEYIHRQTVNKKEGLEVPRIFVQGKFVKPSEGGAHILGCELVSEPCIHCDKLCQTVPTTNQQLGNRGLSDGEISHKCIRDNCERNESTHVTDLCHQNMEEKLSRLSLEIDECSMNAKDSHDHGFKDRAMKEVNSFQHINVISSRNNFDNQLIQTDKTDSTDHESKDIDS